MLGLKVIRNKELMTYDDYVFDYTSGKWISVVEYEELERELEADAMWSDYGCGL
jgi:hypothetical protein